MESVAKDGGDATSVKFVEVTFLTYRPSWPPATSTRAGYRSRSCRNSRREDTFVVAPYQNTIPGLTTLTTFTTAKPIRSSNPR